MLGAILGSIIGSTYVHNPIKTKDFDLFPAGSGITEDTVMTVAVGLVTAAYEGQGEEDYTRDLCRFMRLLGRAYPDAGYGSRFTRWLTEEEPDAYRSFGNASAARVSAVGWRAESLEEAETIARWSASVTHDHPDGMKGAAAVAAAVYLARTEHDMGRLRGYVGSYYYPLDFRIDRVRSTYRFDPTCPGTVPYAIEAFLESTSFEDAIRNAVSLGGDTDTMAAVTGAVAEAYYGIPPELGRKALGYLDPKLSRMFAAYASRLYKR